MILLSVDWQSLDEMLGFIIYYFYLISSLSIGKVYIVNTSDNERHRPNRRDMKNISYDKAGDNSLADYSDYLDAGVK